VISSSKTGLRSMFQILSLSLQRRADLCRSVYHSPLPELLSCRDCTRRAKLLDTAWWGTEPEPRDLPPG